MPTIMWKALFRWALFIHIGPFSVQSWSHRLVVRTLASHASNRGSNPRGITIWLKKGFSLSLRFSAVSGSIGTAYTAYTFHSLSWTIALARSIICALAADRLMLSGADIARKLDITPSAVSKLVARGRAEPLLSQIAAKIRYRHHLFNFSWALYVRTAKSYAWDQRIWCVQTVEG